MPASGSCLERNYASCWPAESKSSWAVNCQLHRCHPLLPFARLMGCLWSFACSLAGVRRRHLRLTCSLCLYCSMDGSYPAACSICFWSFCCGLHCFVWLLPSSVSNAPWADSLQTLTWLFDLLPVLPLESHYTLDWSLWCLGCWLAPTWTWRKYHRLTSALHASCVSLLAY